MIIAVIPAKSGSLRLKNKNIKILNKKPMVYWSIKYAKTSKLLDKIYEKCLNGEKIEILGNGKFYRDYIHVEDVADAINCTIETRNQMNEKKYYLGSGQAVYLKKAFTIIREVAFRKTGKFSEIKETNIPGNINKIHLRHFQADITEFSQVSGWCLQKNCTTYECNKS